MDRAKRAVLILLVMSICWLAGCAEVGITGRRQLNFMPDSVINSLSLEQYSTFISQNKVSGDAEKTAMVKRCGERIRKAVDEYCRQYCDENPFEGYEWEFNLVEDDAVNAFAMPGGKVVVYTGLLPVAQNETGLAVVMGHEIAHVFADHGAERMSQNLLMQGGQIALSELLKEKPQQTRDLFVTSYGLGAQVAFMLPFSRLHENEADRLGLIFMAMAGYDPHVAVEFWQRMAAAKEGSSSPPEILSTHPADETRIANMQRLLPEALEYYRPAN